MERRRFVATTAALATTTTGWPDAARGAAEGAVGAAGAADATVARPSPPGPLLAPGLLQPLDLRYEYAEMHAMLYLYGHPDYEAIEAMIGPEGQDGRPVRMILTRHDQSQVDHVGDPRMLRDVAGLDRRVVHQPMSIDVRADGPLPSATLRLQSWRGEAIVFTVVALAPPDATRAGLTDPGGHSAGTSLPVMLRERSTLAGPGSALSIDGRACALASLSGGGPGGPMIKGYLTIGHHLPVLRAGERAFAPMAGPARWAVGETCRVDDGRSERGYVVQALDDQGRIMLACAQDRPERVHLVRDSAGLRLTGLEVSGVADIRRSARLTFDAAGGFAIGVGNRDGLVTGRWQQSETGDLRLTPERPAWASRRPVGVAVRLEGTQLVVRTRIG